MNTFGNFSKILISTTIALSTQCNVLLVAKKSLLSRALLSVNHLGPII